ncbi:TPA: helix-turn-helix transcriptional regulator [Morganella morganii]
MSDVNGVFISALMLLFFYYLRMTLMFKVCINRYTGDKIRGLRKNNNLTTAQLGGVVGVSQQQMSRYKRGESKIDIILIYTLSVYFDCLVEYFFPDDTEIVCDVLCSNEDKVINSICSSSLLMIK